MTKLLVHLQICTFLVDLVLLEGLFEGGMISYLLLQILVIESLVISLRLLQLLLFDFVFYLETY